MLSDAIDNQTLKKLILSRPSDKSILRTEGHLFEKKGEIFLQLETFTADGKALHRNVPIDEAVDTLIAVFADYRQLNLITTGGNAEARLSSKDKLLLSGKLKSGARVEAATHDREKKHILYEGTSYDFLIALGVTDSQGMIVEKKRAKFRQINRYIEFIDDIVRNDDREVWNIIDFGCGKSYLTFVLYHYLTEIRKVKAEIVGLDLKADVIKRCGELAERYGMT